MRERAPAFRSADHNADSACKPRQRAPADQAGAGEAARDRGNRGFDSRWPFLAQRRAAGHEGRGRSLHPDARRLRDGRLCNWPGHSLR